MVAVPMKIWSLMALALASTLVAQAKIVTKDVAYEHDGVKLEGYLAYDDSARGKSPGVLVIHEWWGLNSFTKGRAEALAKQGYVAFAADMYGAGQVTTDADKAKAWSGPFYGQPIMAQRARAGLDQLLKTGLVDDQRVAAIGFCFGGSSCLALAYSGAPVNAVVTFHGGLFPAPAGSLEKSRTKFLILQGENDPFVPQDARISFKKSLDDAKSDYQFVTYSGAVHAFTNPEADQLASKNKLNGIGYNEPAARRSWAQMLAFFDEVLKKS